MFFTNYFNSLDATQMENYHKSVFMNMEGEVAERARASYYKQTLRLMGDNVKIGRSVTIVNPQFISIGNNVTINDGCTLIARGSLGITISDGVSLMHRVYLDTESAETGYIHIGKEVYIGTGCLLHGHQGLEIGDMTLLAQNITITPYSHYFDDCDKLIRDQGGNTRKVIIGKDCYIGMSCCVLYGADIEDGSVVGSGSTVVHTIPPYSLAVGTPAKVIRKRGQKKESTQE